MNELLPMKLYHDLLEQTEKLALATSAESAPNVRIVNFVHDLQHPDVLFFASDRTNDKVTELTVNPSIAFTTVPTKGIAHVRSRQATVKRSPFSIYEMAPLFIGKIADYEETIEQIGKSLDVFEIHIREAILVSGFEEPVPLYFSD